MNKLVLQVIACKPTHCWAEEGGRGRGRAAGCILGGSTLGINLLAVNFVDDGLVSMRMPANTELHSQHTNQM